MEINLPGAITPDVKGFLTQVVQWARDASGIEAVALVGSYARGEAKPASDIDLVLLCENPKSFLSRQHWITAFGKPTKIEKENWGKVTSLRVWYAQELEVEFGITSDEWGADPADQGDGQVIRDGIVVLYEIDSRLSDRVTRFEESLE